MGAFTAVSSYDDCDMTMTVQPAVLPSHAQFLDRMYGVQRHFYDLTRKHYLHGRDNTLRRILRIRPESVLEVGCGTARNLLWLADRSSIARLIGIDASTQMLATAQRKIVRARREKRIEIRFELAETLEWREAEHGARPEVILFSYSLTMIPEWRRALARAYDLLPVGGRLIVLDFWDQHTYPGVLRLAIRKWLALFSVTFKPEHLEALQALRSEGALVHFTPIGGSYAYRVEVKKRP